MFDSLSDRLNDTFDRLRGKGKLTEADITSAMRDIRMALLEADVNFKVVKEFVAKTKERCMTAEVMESLSPAQNVVKIVLDELTEMLGSTESKLVFSNRIPNVIMLVGLQGSGKTTAAAKLAYRLKQENHSPLLIAGDVYRPAAADQLQTLGDEIGVRVYRGDGRDPVAIAREGIQDAIDNLRDVVIIDTAGRLHVDADMMEEAQAIKDATHPDQILMVVDAMTGQDVVNVVEAFAESVDFDGVIMSKMDGDARGGGALSIREVTGKPIKFISSGEIGELAIIRVCHMTPGLAPGEGHEFEGPSFHDCGMHYVDIARWYAGCEYKTWHSQGVNMWSYKDPWWVQCHGTFQNGVVFDITQGFVYGQLSKDQTHNSYVDIIGTKGIARMTHDFKTAVVDLRGVTRTERIEKPFGGKNIDVLCDLFADSIETGTRNPKLPLIRVYSF